MNMFARLAVIAFAASTLAACAVSADDGDARDTQTTEAEAAPAAPAPDTSDEEHVGQTSSEMKWNPPLCSYFRWQCGACICDACNVVDCRGGTLSP